MMFALKQESRISPTRFTLKLFLIIILVLVSNAVFSQMRQIHLDLINTNNEIKKLSFYNPAEGYIACTGSSGGSFVGYTTDSGRTYIKRHITLGNVNYNSYSVNLTFGFYISGVKAFNQNVIIAYGDYGLVPSILYSNNGGLSYNLIYHSQFNPFQLSSGIEDLVFPENNSIGFAVDADRILKTNNQGLSWTVSRTDPGSFFTNLEAIDNNNVFVLSTGYSSNKLLKTTNGGSTWQTVTLPALSGGKMVYAHFLTALKGWLSMTDDNNKYYFYKTTDGGNSWVQLNHTEATPFWFSKIKFIDENIGYALSDQQNTVMKTFDSGVIWEPLSRDNDFSYLGFSHRELLCISPNQLWAAGYREFLELSANGGGTPKPKAYFRIDTAGLSVSNTVNLVNYSRPGYTYQWFLNNAPLATTYHASYTHNVNRVRDTIKLVVSNGIETDTTIKYQDFFLPVIVSSFTPAIGVTGTAVTITGLNFIGATSVRFGGTPAGFSVVSNTQINAVVANGASGAVTVTTPQGTGVLNGFTYFPPPAIDLPTTVSDTILCKAEPVSLFIQNTQPNVRYDFIDSLNTSYGSVNGNGATAGLITSPVSRTGNYRIKATRLNIASSATFTRKIFIVVEQTKSVVTASRNNIIQGEKVNFFNQSKEAATFQWTFNEDASISTSTIPHPQNISYTSPGQKTLSLISTSSNGCRDTLSTNAVYVYTKPVPDATCYGLAINDSDFSYFPQSPASVNEALLTADNGYIISGFGNKPKLKSRLGNDKNFVSDGTAYVAKYTTDGVLSWNIYIKAGGNFYATEKDNAGNIYILGSCKVLNYLTLVNGDSIRVAATPTDTIVFSGKTNGFILKLDPDGNYLWHTIIDDPSPEFQGYPVMGGLPAKITINGNQIAVSGSFLANLGYCRNGIKQTLITLPNSTDPNTNQNNFTLRIREDGSLVWHMYMQNNATNQKRGIYGMGIDGAKNYYLAGIYENYVIMHDAGNVNDITYTGTVGDASSFLFKYDSTGRLIWKMNFRNSFVFRDVYINDIAVDPAGNCYITGSSSLQNNTQYFQITNSNGSTSNVSNASYFLVKIDSGGIYRWSSGSRYSYYGQGNAVLINGNDVYTTGGLSNNGVPSATFIMTSTDGNNLSLSFHETEFFIARYDTAGVLKRVTLSGQNIGGHVVPNNILKDQNQHFLISGMIDNYNGGAGTFNAFNTSLATSGVDGFIIKINADYCYSLTPPPANAGYDRVKCAGDTAILGINTSGNSYSWSSNPAGFSSTLSSPVVSPLVTTSYFLTVTNAAGLIAKDTVLITVNTLPVANAGADQSVCTGNQITLGSAGVAGNIYSWSSNPAGFSSSQPNPSVAPATVTQYFLTVTNAAGCIKKDTVIITPQNTVAPTITISGNTTVTNGQAVTISSIQVNGGSTPAYQWQDSTTTHNWQNISGATSSTINYTPAQTGDKLRCILTSNATCVLPATATSNALSFVVSTATAINPVNSVQYGINYFPNPVQATLYIDSLKLTDQWQTLTIITTEGRTINSSKNISNRSAVTINVEHLPAGTYIAILRRKKGEAVYLKFIKQ